MKAAVGPDALDCSRPRTLVFWFIVGAALGIGVMNAYGEGPWSSLLHVGSGNPLLHKIESELGAVSTPNASGHDGQLYYLIARDPMGTHGTPRALVQYDNGPRYRYRRILYPLLAGGVGALGGRATLAGMIMWLAFAMGLATIAIADLCFQFNVRGPSVLVATFNAGALMSLLLLTADALALALALTGISLSLRSRRGWAVAAFALAALTKEVYLLVPWSLAAWSWKERQRGTALSLAVLPVLPIVAWSGWVAMSFPDAATTVENIGAPLVGLVEAIPTWVRHERNRGELFMLTFVGLSFVAASVMVVVGRSGVLRWLVVPWLILGCVSAHAVWIKPNNAARVFAILWPLSILLLSEWLSDRRKRPPTSA